MFYVFIYAFIYQTHFILVYLFSSTLSMQLTCFYCNIIVDLEQKTLLYQMVIM